MAVGGRVSLGSGEGFLGRRAPGTGGSGLGSGVVALRGSGAAGGSLGGYLG